ncbi:MAG: alkane 1-monooxygenase [Brevirhabdus sp.]
MQRNILGFGLATALPVTLIVLGALLGGGWVWAALASITALVAGLDALFDVGDGETRASDRAADALSLALVVAHFVVLAAVVAAIAGPSPLSGAEKAALFLATGLFMGQVSNSNAHELIHRAPRLLRRAGALVFISHLFGHHTTAHPAVHHRFVATPDDPNSAQLGESVYGFALRAWAGSFRAGLKVEAKRLEQKGHGAMHPSNPYWGYGMGGLSFLALSFFAFGPGGLLTYAALAGYATFQLLLSDYVQHYGLRRDATEAGYEPVDARHSWNAPQWYSSLLMLNAPRHSDHHAHPSTPYPRLSIPEGAPILPRSLPVMATLAMMPRLWRRVMDKRVAKLRHPG